MNHHAISYNNDGSLDNIQWAAHFKFSVKPLQKKEADALQPRPLP